MLTSRPGDCAPGEGGGRVATWRRRRPSDLSKRDMAYFITADQPGAWVEIDFLCGVVLPTQAAF